MAGAPGARGDFADGLHGYYIEDLTEGMTAAFGKTITDADILMFAGVSGDTNPVHLNEEFALGTPFHGPDRARHAHRQPDLDRARHQAAGPRLHLSQPDPEVPGPGAGRRHRARRGHASRSIDRERRRCVFDTVCKVGGKNVLEGEALMMVPRRPAAPAA